MHPIDQLVPNLWLDRIWSLKTLNLIFQLHCHHHSTATQHQHQTEQNGIGSWKGKRPELSIYTNIFIRLTQCGKVIKLLKTMNKAQDRNEMMYPIYIHCYPYQYQLLFGVDVFALIRHQFVSLWL